jgi:hypothetical protein
VLPLAAVARPAKYSWVALPVMANAPDVTTRLVGKEHVATEIDGLPRTLETAANPSKGARSMSASMDTSTSASFGMGLSVTSEPTSAIRRTPGHELAARTNASTA